MFQLECLKRWILKRKAETKRSQGETSPAGWWKMRHKNQSSSTISSWGEDGEMVISFDLCARVLNIGRRNGVRTFLSDPVIPHVDKCFNQTAPTIRIPPSSSWWLNYLLTECMKLMASEGFLWNTRADVLQDAPVDEDFSLKLDCETRAEASKYLRITTIGFNSIKFVNNMLCLGFGQLCVWSYKRIAGLIEYYVDNPCKFLAFPSHLRLICLKLFTLER